MAKFSKIEILGITMWLVYFTDLCFDAVHPIIANTKSIILTLYVCGYR